MSLRMRKAWFKALSPAAIVFAVGLVTSTTVLALFLLGPLSSGSSPSHPAGTQSDSEFGLAVPPSPRGPDALAFVGLTVQVSQRVEAAFPDAVLKQVDVDGGGGRTQFRFLVTAPDGCKRDLPPADDSPEIRRFYADKCDVSVTVTPANAPADEWQWRLAAPWLGDMNGPPVDPSAIQVGPETVGQAATGQWPDCAPHHFTLAATQGPLTWHIFCAQPDGGTFRGIADARTGASQPQGGPFYPPRVAGPSP